MKCPIVSVNMSAYNTEQYVAEAVDSMMGQTAGDLELVIVDDGSQDDTLEVLSRYKDPRLRVVSQTHRGISHARNHALRLSRGRYIAVMDSDDVSMPTRLERQIDFLESHSAVGVVGTAARFVDELEGREWDYAPPTADEALRRHLVRGNPFVHTSVMMHRSLLEEVGGYNEKYPYLVDYELFVRLAPRTRFANLSEALVVHRQRMGSVSVTMRTELLRLWLRLCVHYRAFRDGTYPWHEFRYVLRPIVLAAIELRPKLRGYLRQLRGRRRGP